MLCVGRYCAGETMLDRLMSMANSNLQIGRYRRSINDRGVCGGGFRSEDTIKFSRAFTEAPTVLTTIYHYDICNNGANMRAVTWVESADPTGFKAVATTWADTQLYAIGVQVLHHVLSLSAPRPPFPCCVGIFRRTNTDVCGEFSAVDRNFQEPHGAAATILPPRALTARFCGVEHVLRYDVRRCGEMAGHYEHGELAGGSSDQGIFLALQSSLGDLELHIFRSL